MILVSWLFALVLLALARFAGAQGGLVSRSVGQARAEDVARVTQLVLNRELRTASVGDISAWGGDSIRIRAVRGSGPLCPATAVAEPGGSGASAGAVAADEVVVRYRGVRLPDAAKDSLLLIHSGSAAGTARDIVAAAADPGCEGGIRLSLSAAVPPHGLALIFETGSYSLSGGAFRYRRGAGGRQPLTEAILGASDLEPMDGGFLARIHFSPDSLPGAGPSDRSFRVLLQNGSVP